MMPSVLAKARSRGVFLIRLGVVIHHDAHGWRVEVVELTASYRPEKSPDGASQQEQGEWNQDVEYRHGLFEPVEAQGIEYDDQ